jgi:RNA polymerase sigma factor (sigma-70 family)
MLTVRVDQLHRRRTTDTVLSPDQRQQFTHLYRELFPPLFGYVHFRVLDRHTAEDVTARVFERALAGLAGVREPDRARAWLFGIARNTIADHYRAHRTTVTLDDVESVDQLLVEPPDGVVERADEIRRLVGHLSALSERERELVGLKFVAGLTNRDIARVVGLSETNVAQILRRVLLRLRRQLDEEATR